MILPIWIMRRFFVYSFIGYQFKFTFFRKCCSACIFRRIPIIITSVTGKKLSRGKEVFIMFNQNQNNNRQQNNQQNRDNRQQNQQQNKNQQNGQNCKDNRSDR